MSTQIKRLYQSNKEFVPITLAEAVVVNSTSIPLLNQQDLGITTLDKVLRYTLGYSSSNISSLQEAVNSINEQLKNKQNKLTAGTGITITEDGVISVNINVELYKIVQELPEPSKDCINSIYLVPSSDVARNIFVEYICVENGDTYSWETLGSIQTEVDLTGYVTKEEFNTALSNTISAIDVTISNGQAKVVVDYEIPADLYDSLVSTEDDDKIITG